MNIPTTETLANLMALAAIIVKSNFFPALKSAESAATIILMGAGFGLDPMQSIRCIHIIDGKPTPSADLIIGAVKRSPVCQWFRLVESTTTAATYETQRQGEAQPTTHTYSIDDAKRAGLAGRGSWQKYPSAMLRARCASTLARIVYPDLISGLVEDDEDTATIAPQSTETATPEKRGRVPMSEAKSILKRSKRGLSMKGMSTREAARFIATELVSAGLHQNTDTAVRAIVAETERMGLANTDVTVEALLDCWMTLNP